MESARDRNQVRIDDAVEGQNYTSRTNAYDKKESVDKIGISTAAPQLENNSNNDDNDDQTPVHDDNPEDFTSKLRLTSRIPMTKILAAEKEKSKIRELESIRSEQAKIKIVSKTEQVYHKMK